MRIAYVAALVLFAALTIAAREEPTHACPVCGNEKAAFDDSPEGVWRKFQAAFVAGDVELAKECVPPSGPADWESFRDLHGSMGLGLLVRMRVVECNVQDDVAEMTVAYLGGEPTIELTARRADGGWRLDFGGEHPIEDLATKLIKSWAPAAGKSLEQSRQKANGTSAQAALKQIVSTEGVWRMIDSDRNGCQDYWTLDVAAFYCMNDVDGNALRYIDVSMARADRAGWPAYAKDAPAPKHGYWLRAMKTDETGQPYAQDVDGDGKAVTNPAKYAFCAYPAEYGKTGTMSYIVNEEGVVYEMDLGVDAKEGLDGWPAEDPETAGWKACE